METVYIKTVKLIEKLTFYAMPPVYGPNRKKVLTNPWLSRYLGKYWKFKLTSLMNVVNVLTIFVNQKLVYNSIIKMEIGVIMFQFMYGMYSLMVCTGDILILSDWEGMAWTLQEIRVLNKVRPGLCYNSKSEIRNTVVDKRKDKNMKTSNDRVTNIWIRILRMQLLTCNFAALLISIFPFIGELDPAFYLLEIVGYSEEGKGVLGKLFRSAFICVVSFHIIITCASGIFWYIFIGAFGLEIGHKIRGNVSLISRTNYKKVHFLITCRYPVNWNWRQKTNQISPAVHATVHFTANRKPTGPGKGVDLQGMYNGYICFCHDSNNTFVWSDRPADIFTFPLIGCGNFRVIRACFFLCRKNVDRHVQGFANLLRQIQDL